MSEQRFWCVMKAYKFDSLSVGLLTLTPPKEGPHRFIPLFNSLEQAIAFDGSDEHVYEMTGIAKDPQ